MQVGGDGVRKLRRLIHTDGSNDGFVIERLLELHVLLKERGNALHELFDRRRHLKFGFAGAHGGDEESVAIIDLDRLGALYTLDQHFDIAVGHFDALHNVADGPDLIDLLGFRLVNGGIVLGGEKDLAVAGERFFEGAHAGKAAHDEGSHHVGKYHHIPDGHHGKLAWFSLIAGGSHWHTFRETLTLDARTAIGCREDSTAHVRIVQRNQEHHDVGRSGGNSMIMWRIVLNGAWRRKRKESKIEGSAKEMNLDLIGSKHPVSIAGSRHERLAPSCDLLS